MQQEKIIREYLQEIEDELQGVSRKAKREFLREIESHLLEEWEMTEEKSQVALLNMLERFGDPTVIAAEFQGKRESLGTPSWVIILLTVFVWPVGIVLAWLSPLWSRRDKAIATFIPVLSLILLLVGSFAVYTEFSAVGEIQITDTAEMQQFEERVVEKGSRFSERFWGLVYSVFLGILLLTGNPLFSGIYLAIMVRA